jgi:hypothetical protein
VLCAMATDITSVFLIHSQQLIRAGTHIEVKQLCKNEMQ